MMPKHKWLLSHVSYKGDNCLIWPFSCASPGYGQLMIERKLWMAHRLMCLLIHGEPPTKKHHAAHSCGNRKCVNPNHLSWKTGSQNQMDRLHQGRPFTGRRRHLTPDQIRQIREAQGKISQVKLAKQYNCTESNIRHIQTGATYRHVT